MERKREILLRSVIKEELVILTMHRDEAAILQQFLYWTPRCNSYQLFLTEETLRMHQELLEFEGGWIYKTAEQLKHELLMIDTNVKTVRKYLKNLIDKGFLIRRKNPDWKVDRTYQYRINLRKLADELNAKGHHLDGFEQFSINIIEPPVYYLYHRDQGHWISTGLSETNSQKETLDNENLDVDLPKKVFPTGKKSLTIPEITSKITNKEHLTNNTLEMNDDYNVIVNKFLSISRKEFVSKEDQRLIREVLSLDNDISRIVSLMDNCYKLKNDLDSRGAAEGEVEGKSKGIWSFKYIYNYVIEEMGSNDGRGSVKILGRETNESEEILGQSDYSSIDGGWSADLECDF